MAPHSFNLEDANECNAVEYAIANNADMTAIKTMQQTARDDLRLMKAMERRKTQGEMERVVGLSANEARATNVSLSEVIAPCVSRRNLYLSRSMQSLRDNSCFPNDSASKSVAVIIVRAPIRPL